MLDNGGDVDFFTGQHGILEGIKKYRSQDPKFKPVIELMEKYSKRAFNFTLGINFKGVLYKAHF